jgi:hypothetical protein
MGLIKSSSVSSCISSGFFGFFSIIPDLHHGFANSCCPLMLLCEAMFEPKAGLLVPVLEWL